MSRTSPAARRISRLKSSVLGAFSSARRPPSAKNDQTIFGFLDRKSHRGAHLGVSCGQKKTEVAPCLFNRASQASRPGFRLAPQVVSLHPRWVANCYWCRLSATLFYLSTLPPASPSLPSAVGRSSVPVGIGNITKAGRRVKKLGPLFPFLFYLFFKFYETSCALFLR